MCVVAGGSGDSWLAGECLLAGGPRAAPTLRWTVLLQSGFCLESGFARAVVLTGVDGPHSHGAPPSPEPKWPGFLLLRFLLWKCRSGSLFLSWLKPTRARTPVISWESKGGRVGSPRAPVSCPPCSPRPDPGTEAPRAVQERPERVALLPWVSWAQPLGTDCGPGPPDPSGHR